jgi:hypothetical protein
MTITSGKRETLGQRVSKTFSNGSQVSGSNTMVPSFNETWSRNSFVTPGYMAQLTSRFGLPFNKYGYSVIRITHWNGRWLNSYPWGYADSVVGVWGTFSSYVPDDFTSFEVRSANDEAVGKALGRAKDQTANWAENLATSKQSYKMITGLMTRVIKAYRAARQGNFARAASHLGVSLSGPNRRDRQTGSLASGWLELQYGWLPLLSDIFATVTAIQQYQAKKAPLIRVSATVARDKSRTGTSNFGNRLTTLVYETKLTSKVILYFRLENEDLRTVAQMGITNPVALAWELLPFSFVLDWLLPIGNYLSNLDSTLGLIYVKGGVTVCKDCKVKAILTSSSPYEDVFLQAEHQLFSVNRDSFPVKPSQKVPHFKNPVSEMHVANAMALLRQQRR